MGNVTATIATTDKVASGLQAVVNNDRAAKVGAELNALSRHAGVQLEASWAEPE